MPRDERTPVVVAVGQAIERDVTVSPVDMAVRAAEVALGQAGSLRCRIDVVTMVNVFSGAGAAPATLLARRLGLHPTRTEMTTIGGNTPQWLVNRAAKLIAASEAEAVLIAGGEAQRSLRIQHPGDSQGSWVTSRGHSNCSARNDPGSTPPGPNRMNSDPTR